MSTRWNNIGGRNYKVVPLLNDGEGGVKGYDNIVQRAVERGFNTNTAEEEGEHIFEHRRDFPANNEARYSLFIFPGWSNNVLGEGACFYLECEGGPPDWEFTKRCKYADDVLSGDPLTLLLIRDEG